MPMKKKEKKKKVSFTLGGLTSSSSHFDNIDLLNETHIQALLPSMPEAVAMATPQDIGECLQCYNDSVMYGYDNKYDRLDCYHSAFTLGGDSENKFARHHWMIDSGCTDHLLPFTDDFAHLGNQGHHAGIANGQKVLMYGPDTVRLLFSQKINKQNLLFSRKCGMLHMWDTDFCLY